MNQYSLLLDPLKHYQLCLAQLNPNSIRMLIGFLILCKVHTITPSVNLFRRFFTVRMNGKEPGWYGFAKRPTAAALIAGTPSSVHGWKPRYFYASTTQAADLPPWRDGETSRETDRPSGFSSKDELTLSSTAAIAPASKYNFHTMFIQLMTDYNFVNFMQVHF